MALHLRAVKYTKNYMEQCFNEVLPRSFQNDEARRQIWKQQMARKIRSEARGYDRTNAAREMGQSVARPEELWIVHK